WDTLLVLDHHNAKLARASRGFHRREFAHLTPEEGAADGGVERDLLLGRVGLGREDDLVSLQRGVLARAGVDDAADDRARADRHDLRALRDVAQQRGLRIQGLAGRYALVAGLVYQFAARTLVEERLHLAQPVPEAHVHLRLHRDRVRRDGVLGENV